MPSAHATTAFNRNRQLIESKIGTSDRGSCAPRSGVRRRTTVLRLIRRTKIRPPTKPVLTSTSKVASCRWTIIWTDRSLHRLPTSISRISRISRSTWWRAISVRCWTIQSKCTGCGRVRRRCMYLTTCLMVSYSSSICRLPVKKHPNKLYR